MAVVVAAVAAQTDPAKRVRVGGRATAGLAAGGNLLAMAGSVGVPTTACRTAATSAPISPEARTSGRRPAQTRTAKALAAAAAATAATTAAAAAEVVLVEAADRPADGAAGVAMAGVADMGVRVKAPVCSSRLIGSGGDGGWVSPLGLTADARAVGTQLFHTPPGWNVAKISHPPC